MQQLAASQVEPAGAPPAPAPAPALRQPGLDVVRACAIVLVMVHHFRLMPGAPPWLVWFGLRGAIGVDLFFVLSGWLIGGQLVRELRTTGGLRLGRFWARRWLRTLPAYYAVLGVVALSGRGTARELASMVVFAQNYLPSRLWIVTWSLCVEEHFYLALPLLFLLARRLPRPARWALVLVAIGISPALRWSGWAEMVAGSYQDFLRWFYRPTHLRLEGLALGVAMAVVAQHAPGAWSFLQRRAVPLCIAGVATVVAAAWSPSLAGATVGGRDRMAFFAAVCSFLAASVGTAMTLPLATRRVARIGLRWGAFVWVAEHAYALYLTHEFVPYAVWRAFPGASRFWPRLALAFAASFLVAALLRRLVEVPGLRLRDRLLRA